MASPAWWAVMVQGPTVVMCTRAPVTEQLPVAVKVTVWPNVEGLGAETTVVVVVLIPTAASVTAFAV